MKGNKIKGRYYLNNKHGYNRGDQQKHNLVL